MSTATIKQQTVVGLVAVGTITASLADGLFEPIGYAAASVVIWTAVIAGVASRALPSTPVARAAVVGGICLTATAALATASMGWASDQGRAFEEAVRVAFYLGLFALAACTAGRHSRAQWIAGLTLGLGVVSVLALISYFQPELLGSRSADIPNAAGRLSYPLGYWNGMAALMALAGVLLAYAGARAPDRRLRAAATGGIPLALLGVWLTSSRGGAAAAVIGLLVLVVCSRDRVRQLAVLVVGAVGTAILIIAAEQMPSLSGDLVDAATRSDGDRMSAITISVLVATAAITWALDARIPPIRIGRRLRLALAAAAVCALAAALVAIHPAERFRQFKAPPPPTGALASEGTAGGYSSNGRWQYWSEAIDAFESRPLAGVGAGGYEDWWARHAPLFLFVRNPHSLPIQQAAELGTLGLLLFGGFVAAVGLAAGRRLREGAENDTGALLAVLVAGALPAAVDWTWELPAAFGAVVIAAALLTSSAPSRSPVRDSYWLGMATVGAAWIAIVISGLVVLGELELRSSRSEAAGDRIDRGIDAALAARTVQPWSAEPYTQLALLEERKGDYGEALMRLRQAEERDSEDWRLPLIEARVQRKRGDASAARLALERARHLSPLLPIFQRAGSEQG